MTTPSLKVCYKCRAELPLTEFYRDLARPDGLHNKCKACAKAYDRKRAMLPHRVETRANYNRENPQKHEAHRAVFKAVRSGELKKPDCCQKCGETGIIHGHHHDYSKPLDVMWLCPKCHAAEHMEMAS